MFSEAPELYDLIYSSFKDYAAESEQIAALCLATVPEAKSILDVGCGTGEHARHLRSDYSYLVDGLDIEPGFVELARAKLPEARFWVGDMADFSIGQRYDVILSLFSSIAYLRDLERVESALRCFRRHLNPNGVVFVEPWFEPDAWTPGRVYVHTTETDELQAVRMSYSGVSGRISTLDFHYLIGTPAGLEHREERHELGLFTRSEMSDVFERAGFNSLDYDAKGLIGRGMYIARCGD